MTSQFDQRELLLDKCLEQAAEAFEKQDIDTAMTLLARSVELVATQVNAMELMSPEAAKLVKATSEWAALCEALQGLGK